MHSGVLTVPTDRKMKLVDITDRVVELVAGYHVVSAQLHLFNPHTTAGLTINEGADPAVAEDIIEGLRQCVPLDYPYKHLEGNSPAHIMASLMGCSLNLFIEDNRVLLGTWQRIFFCEFDGPRTRKLNWRITHNIAP